MRWFRHYTGMMRDPKMVGIAARSRQPIERVAYVWGCILEDAAERWDGGAYSLDGDSLSYFLRCDPADIAVIVSEMESVGMTAKGRVAKWSERQFESDRDPTNAQRQKRWRQRDKERHNALLTDASRPPEAEAEQEGLKPSCDAAAVPISDQEQPEPPAPPDPDDALLDRLLAAVGRDRSSMPPAMADVSPIKLLLAEGIGIETVIATIAAKGASRAGRRAASWAWFVAAIREAKPRSGAPPVSGDRGMRIRPSDARWLPLWQRWCERYPDNLRHRSVAARIQVDSGGGWVFPESWVADLLNGREAA